MCKTPDYACDNSRDKAREAPRKKTKEILFSHLPTANPRASGQSITVFIFLRALHDIYSEQGSCMKVCTANVLVHDIKSCLLGSSEKSPKSRTRKDARVRGKRKVRLLRFVVKFIRDRGKLFFFLRIWRLSRAFSRGTFYFHQCW